MNNEDIFRMAREAGAAVFPHASVFSANDIARFAVLVADAEREACAKLCEARFVGDLNREDMEARRCAAAIRARGNT